MGLTHVQFVLLAAVWWLSDRAEDPSRAPSQRQVAEHAEVDVMMTSQVLRALAKRGLVARTLDDTDARVKRLTITDTGRRLARRAVTVVEVADVAFFTRARDPAQLLNVLHQLADDTNLEPAAGTGEDADHLEPAATATVHQPT